MHEFVILYVINIDKKWVNLNRDAGNFLCTDVEQYIIMDLTPNGKQYECLVKDILVIMSVKNQEFVPVGDVKQASHHYIAFCGNEKNIGIDVMIQMVYILTLML